MGRLYSGTLLNLGKELGLGHLLGKIVSTSLVTKCRRFGCKRKFDFKLRLLQALSFEGRDFLIFPSWKKEQVYWKRLTDRRLRSHRSPRRKNSSITFSFLEPLDSNIETNRVDGYKRCEQIKAWQTRLSKVRTTATLRLDLDQWNQPVHQTHYRITWSESSDHSKQPSDSAIRSRSNLHRLRTIKFPRCFFSEKSS